MTRELDRIQRLGDEDQVRAAVVALNAKIDEANRAIWGPPSTTPPLDEEAVVEAWRGKRET